MNIKYDDTNNGMLIPEFRKRKLAKAKEQIFQWKMEGKTVDEVKQMVDEGVIREFDRRAVLDSDIDEVFGVKIDEKEEVDDDKETIDDVENYFYNDEIEIFKNINNEDKEEKKEDKNNIVTNIVEIEDEKLDDFKDQPFKMYDEEQKEDMIRSIKLNGIIEPIVVRPMENGKYQILSGHNRRLCGRLAGLKVFPCKIKEGLSDEEAMLYLVDTNLTQRKEITPMERAKALLIRKNSYTAKKIKAKIEYDLFDNSDNVDIREKIQEIENMSNGSLQRYLRLNYLNKELQDLVDQGKIKLKTAEQLSYISKPGQKQIADLVESQGIKITEKQAKILKEKRDFKVEDIKKFLINGKIKEDESKNEIEEKQNILIEFKKEILQKYFENLNDIEYIKNKIIELLETDKR